MMDIHISHVHQMQIISTCKASAYFFLFFVFFVVLEEGGVKMKLTVIDTPGFGDQINNDNWWVVGYCLDH